MGGVDDVRMRGFRERREVAAVLAILRAGAAPLAAEEVAVADASDRLLAAGHRQRGPPQAEAGRHGRVPHHPLDHAHQV